MLREFEKQPSLELQEAYDQIFGDTVASGADCVAPSMDPSTLNAMPHVIIDDVATNDHVPASDDTFFSSQNLRHSSHLDNLDEENAAFYSNFMNWVGGVLSPNNIGDLLNIKRVPKKVPKLNLYI
ncbi:unnamed protein product [Lactuca virosa]|uniref:Uncharacterized protein n=1 Tax=Lactuca virosa TaxID=75947 RepID=A0AAU9PT49_9ASTR|nr:unnamed protein product [Lactuca virosa]